MRRIGFISGPSPALWVPALIVGLLLLLSPAYLAIRSLGAGQEFWDAAAALAGAGIAAPDPVTGGCGNHCFHNHRPAPGLADGAVRSAPGPNVWGVIVIATPGYSQLRGSLCTIPGSPGAAGDAAGACWKAWVGLERLPDINGFFGASLTLTLLSYPYVLLTIPRRPAAAGPRVGGIFEGAGIQLASHLPEGFGASAAPGHRRWWAAGGLVHAQRLRGRFTFKV